MQWCYYKESAILYTLELPEWKCETVIHKKTRHMKIFTNIEKAQLVIFCILCNWKADHFVLRTSKMLFHSLKIEALNIKLSYEQHYIESYLILEPIITLSSSSISEIFRSMARLSRFSSSDKEFFVVCKSENYQFIMFVCSIYSLTTHQRRSYLQRLWIDQLQPLHSTNHRPFSSTDLSTCRYPI